MRVVFLSLILLLSSEFAIADWAQIQKDLKSFEHNPNKFLNQLPRKSLHLSKFDNQQILTQEFVKKKTQQRQACTRGDSSLEETWSPLAIPRPNDDVEVLLQKPLRSKNIFELNAMNLQEAELPHIPWSGDYWPIAKGVLGQRPFDLGFVNQKGWKERNEYFQSKPMYQLIQVENIDLNKKLSPSEKYELFVGDMNSFLTQHMWLEGKAYYDQSGQVEEWMGICHGWAPASYMLKGPQKTLHLKSHDQSKEFKIYPDELKGLASYLWATSSFESAYVGGRCETKDPEKDKNGRITEDTCFDSNPATWHLAVTHRVGLQKKSFIIDATYDYEVWNQPVVAYHFKYFNTNTKKVTDDLQAAITQRTDLKNDIFFKYRNPASTQIVGVAMRLGYVVEREADDHETEPPPYSSVVWVDYLYDLELNKEGDIIGGEWYSNLHPDFLWTPKDNTRTHSHYDNYAEQTTWSGEGPLPEQWTKASAASHYNHKQVLTPIINTLIEMAQ